MHISQTTKDSLHGEFELEPGNGGERCDYLLEKGIDTYLVLPPKHVANELNGNVSMIKENSKVVYERLDIPDVCLGLAQGALTSKVCKFKF